MITEENFPKQHYSVVRLFDGEGDLLASGSFFDKHNSAYIWLKGDRTKGAPMRDCTLDDVRRRIDEIKEASA